MVLCDTSLAAGWVYFDTVRLLDEAAAPRARTVVSFWFCPARGDIGCSFKMDGARKIVRDTGMLSPTRSRQQQYLFGGNT